MKGREPTSLHGCPARDPIYLMVGPDSDDRILVAQTGRRPALDNRIAINDLLGINNHLLLRRSGSSKWEPVLTTGSIIPIHDTNRAFSE